MMNSYAIVRPEHLNHHGYLFGGAMLKWVDEYAWIAASLDYRGCPLVTVAMNDIVFKHRVVNGSILRFHAHRLKQGSTSVRYAVNVYADAPGAGEERWVFATEVTFVHLDASGNKASLPRLSSEVIQGAEEPIH